MTRGSYFPMSGHCPNHSRQMDFKVRSQISTGFSVLVLASEAISFLVCSVLHTWIQYLAGKKKKVTELHRLEEVSIPELFYSIDLIMYSIEDLDGVAITLRVISNIWALPATTWNWVTVCQQFESWCTQQMSVLGSVREGWQKDADGTFEKRASDEGESYNEGSSSVRTGTGEPFAGWITEVDVFQD